MAAVAVCGLAFMGVADGDLAILALESRGALFVYNFFRRSLYSLATDIGYGN